MEDKEESFLEKMENETAVTCKVLQVQQGEQHYVEGRVDIPKHKVKERTCHPKLIKQEEAPTISRRQRRAKEASSLGEGRDMGLR